MKDIERELSFIKTEVAIVQGIQMLEYYDSNHLSGSPESRGKEKIERLNSVLKNIDKVSRMLGLI